MSLPSRATLEAVATRAGALALTHFRRVTAERKADRSLVTAADREVEALLVAELGALMPEAGIIGEEGSARAGTGDARIVIDPIDGTSAFVAGLPTWGVCIGILRGVEELAAGVVHLPCLGETYSAVGGEAWWNAAPLSPLAGVAAPGDRFVVTHSKAHLRHRLSYTGKVRSFGSAAYHVALVARGSAEAALLGHPYLWDLAGPGAILHAVGGCYEYATGAPVELAALADGRRAPDWVLAGAPAVLAALRPSLGGA